MNRALRTAATGMFGQQLNVDIIANNLANVNTTGYKKSRADFQDLMYQTLKTSEVSDNPNIQQPSEIQVGNGAVPVATPKSFAQGDISRPEPSRCGDSGRRILSDPADRRDNGVFARRVFPDFGRGDAGNCAGICRGTGIVDSFRHHKYSSLRMGQSTHSCGTVDADEGRAA